MEFICYSNKKIVIWFIHIFIHFRVDEEVNELFHSQKLEIGRLFTKKTSVVHIPKSRNKAG